MAKKIISILGLTLILSLSVCACGREAKPLLSATDYDLDAETAETIRGVKIGDDSETFLAAYRDYDILSSINGGDYRFLAAEEIPFTSHQLTTILPSFFVDGSAIELDRFCEENDIEKEALLSFLTDESYLETHTVLYQYLVFTWENGKITDIRSESMDYNRDGSYYEAN
ncbi:MAG: hypothetical protein HDR16_00540 [Lachnospiraceae bacterium]|nr:hypothetical protein [Lachnospiraceae bacterium]